MRRQENVAPQARVRLRYTRRDAKMEIPGQESLSAKLERSGDNVMMSLSKNQILGPSAKEPAVPRGAGLLEFIWLELTPRCNFRCVHCYSDSHPKAGVEHSLTIGSWHSVLRQARDMGCSRVQFIGGEVLLEPDLRSLILRARSLAFDGIELFTNASMLDDDMVDFISDNSVSVATSLYCSKPDIHDAVTRTPGSWQRTTRAIKLLRERSVSVRVGVIAMESNRPWLDETLGFLGELGVTDSRIDEVRAVGRGVQLTGRLESLTELCGHCGNGKLCVAPSGEVYPCVMARANSLGNVNETTLAEISISAAYAVFRSDLIRAKSGRDDPAGLRCRPHGGCSPEEREMECPPYQGRLG